MMQSAFAAALLDPTEPIPTGVVDPQSRPAPKRFSVYRNNVAAGLTRAMEASFPVIRKLVGPEFFAAMAVEFALKHLPKSQILMHYGDDFAGFLETFPPVGHLGYLPDMARLEQAIRTSYHAADAAPVAPEILAAIPGVRLLASRLTLAPALQLVTSRWPIHAIWLANSEGGPPPVAVAQDVVILRPAFDPRPQVLPPGGAGFVAAILQNASFAQAIINGGPNLDLTALLSLLLAGQAITGLTE